MSREYHEQRVLDQLWATDDYRRILSKLLKSSNLHCTKFSFSNTLENIISTTQEKKIHKRAISYLYHSDYILHIVGYIKLDQSAIYSASVLTQRSPTTDICGPTRACYADSQLVIVLFIQSIPITLSLNIIHLLGEIQLPWLCLKIVSTKIPFLLIFKVLPFSQKISHKISIFSLTIRSSLQGLKLFTYIQDKSKLLNVRVTTIFSPGLGLNRTGMLNSNKSATMQCWIYHVHLHLTNGLPLPSVHINCISPSIKNGFC